MQLSHLLIGKTNKSKLYSSIQYEFELGTWTANSYYHYFKTIGKLPLEKENNIIVFNKLQKQRIKKHLLYTYKNFNSLKKKLLPKMDLTQEMLPSYLFFRNKEVLLGLVTLFKCEDVKIISK